MAPHLIVALALTSFPGGRPGDLAKSIAEATKTNVVIEAGASEPIPPFEYDSASLDEMARAVQKASGLRRAPGVQNIFYHAELPSWHFALQAVRQCLNDQARTTGGNTFPAVIGGKVTFQSEKGRSLAAAGLASMNFAKKVSVDPFFERLMLNAWVTDMPEREFLEAVAKALGARIVTNKEGLSLEPLSSEIQRRALATFEAVQKTEAFKKLDPYAKAEIDLAKAAVASANPNALADAARGSGTAKVPIGPAIRQTILPLLRAAADRNLQAQQGFGPPNQPETPLGSRDALARYANVDRRLLGQATIMQGFRVALELQTIDSYGRPGPLVRVP